MSKWRPQKDCLFVIPDIHGNYKELKLILNRILPLRKQDKIVFLGDYIDRGPDSNKVIELLYQLKLKYTSQIITLMGNHEWMLLGGLDFMTVNYEKLGLSHPFNVWINNGGQNTIRSYMKVCGRFNESDILSMTRNRIAEIFPQTHIDFLLSMPRYHIQDRYTFVHASCDPNVDIKLQNEDWLIWDDSLYDTVQNIVYSGKELPWDKTIITGHHHDGPFWHKNFIMLDCSSKKKLLCLELNSMEVFAAGLGKCRLFKLDIEEESKRSC